MGRRCSICTHAARKTLEAAVHAGTSLVEAAAMYPGVTKSSLNRHMTKHVASIVSERVALIDCETVPDPLAFLSPPVRIRERPRPPVEPDARDPLALAGNVVPFRASAPAEPEIEPHKTPTPLEVAILQHRGYSIDDIAQRFGLVEQSVSALMSEVEDGYVRQATGSSSIEIIGRLIFKSEYAIAQLEQDYQAAKGLGRSREARECRRLILAERQELREMLREYGITRPLHPNELHSNDKGRRDADEIWRMIESSAKGVFLEHEPEPVRKPRLIC